MARDVEFNLTASDKTGPALGKAEQAFRKTQQRIKESSEKAADSLYGNSLVRAAAKAAPRITGALMGAVSQAATQSGPILGALGVAAAPVIAGTISAAIIGGAGIGGVLGGVALAARDPRVAAAGKQLGANMLSQLTDFARPFVEPTLAAIDTIEARFGQLAGPLRNIFANASRYVAPLTDGVTRFLQGVVRGADVLIERGAPVIQALSSGLSELGGDAEAFLTKIADGADNAAVSVGQVVDLLGGTLAVLGPLINGVNQVAAGFERLGISPGLLQLIGKLVDAGDATGTFSRHTAGATVAINGTTTAVNGEANSLNALNAVMRTNVSESLSLFDANTQAAQAIRDTTKAVEANGTGLSVNSQRGRENRAALAQLAGTLNRQYDAYVKVNGAGQQADGVLRSNREQFIKVATAASGSAAKARQLADELLGIPEHRKPKVTLLDNASGKIDNVINRLAAVKSKTVTLNIAVRQSGDASALRKQSLPAFSANQHFAQTTGDAGRSRTGGPARVEVAQTLNVALDGKPFYAYTDRRIDDSARRSAWRQKVGPR